MEIKTEKVVVKQEIKKTVIKYRPEEIKELIKQDLLSKGYTATNVRFLADYKYVSDEWGMNSHIVSIFDGAEIEFEETN